MRLFTHSGYFFAISRHHFSAPKKKEEQTAETAQSSMSSEWVAIFGTPGILNVGKDSEFSGELFGSSAHIVI